MILFYTPLVFVTKRNWIDDRIDADYYSPKFVAFRNQIEELSLLPMLQVSQKNPMMQRPTAAAKLIKEYSQALDAKRATLLRILYRVENSAADELLTKLAEFE